MFFLCGTWRADASSSRCAPSLSRASSLRHASDLCRFGVESKLYPNLTAALTGIHAGFYTQSDVADMQAYAKGLGIRVVPEFDFPGHSRGYIPASYGADGVQFCEPTAPTRTQLYGDPSGKTYKVVHDLMKEMSALFEDDVFNIGCDETGVKGPCTQESTFAVERQLFTAIKTELKKTPEGWEEAYFDAQAATNDTIVNAWARHTAAEVTAVGRRAVESRALELALELALVHVRWCTCAGARALAHLRWRTCEAPLGPRIARPPQMTPPPLPPTLTARKFSPPPLDLPRLLSLFLCSLLLLLF